MANERQCNDELHLFSEKQARTVLDSKDALFGSLQTADRVFIQPISQDLDLLTHTWHTDRKYRISNEQGAHLFTALEEVRFCSSSCCGKCCAWIYYVLDWKSGVAMLVEKPSRRSSFFSNIYSSAILELSISNGMRYTIRQCSWKKKRPLYYICDSNEVAILSLRDSSCQLHSHSLGTLTEFEMRFMDRSVQLRYEKDKEEKKSWFGIIKQRFENKNKIIVSLPVDLDVHLKASMLAAAILLDQYHFRCRSILSV